MKATASRAIGVLNDVDQLQLLQKLFSFSD
jgi:hypothetical protein